jgi:hypothetical protein
MPTRRTVLGAGAAFASLSAIDGFAAADLRVRRRTVSPSINALLVDETIEMPPQMATLIDWNRRTIRVVGIRFDASAQAGLARLLSESSVVAGISSGATLFCLERMAWDHGFRLAGRMQLHTSAMGDDASQADVAAFLGGALALRLNDPSVIRAYRPSRADGTLHTWIMQKSRREA